MRTALPILFILCLSVAAEDAEAKKPTLAQTLKREKRGDFEDSTQDAAVQIDAARDRFYAYYSDANDADERKAIHETFKLVTERIMERARKRVREAEERLEQLEQRISSAKRAKT